LTRTPGIARVLALGYGAPLQPLFQEMSMQKYSRQLANAAATLALICAAGSAAAATTELVILQSGPNLSARTQNLLNNLDHIAASPISGIVLDIPATYSATLAGERLDYNTVFNTWMQPLVGTLPKLSNSYLRINVRDAGDPFSSSWNGVLENWSIVARAAKAAGMRGIYFDNEAYQEPLTFQFPGNVANPGLGLAAYQEQYRQRGADVMNAVQSVWANAEIVNLHGPYVSEGTTPQAIRLDQVGADPTDMRGYFFAGMLAAKGAAAKVTDGGELYQYRTQADFDRSVDWRRFAMPQVPGSTVVPASLRGSWADKITLSFGLFDQQWRPNGEYPMNPALLEEALFQAFMHADTPVWLYAEDNDYLKPGGVGQEWINAISNAKARAAIAQVPEPSTWLVMLAGLLLLGAAVSRKGRPS
jgi:hypothetical protein